MQRKKQKEIILSGGLDVVTSQLSIDEGRLLECKNYECDVNGGYRQLSGFERFDGRTAPSEGQYQTVLIENISGTFQVGEVLTGGTSGATGTIFYIGVDALYMGDTTNTYSDTETLTGGTSGATATAASDGAANVVLSPNETRNDIRFEKENYYRQFITAVPGQGNVLGVWRHLDRTLVARDLNGSEKRMYKSTATGWTELVRPFVIFFDSGVAPYPVPGDTIDDGTNSVTVHRISRGTTSSTSGYIVLDGYTTGFNALDNLRLNAVQFGTITASGAASQFELAPGGRVEWESFTFTNSPNQYRVYFTDGVNPCMEYDPVNDYISPIYTDQADIANDKPKFLSIYKNHLFLGYERGILRNSEPLDPYLWDAAAGTVEFQVGAEVTGMEAAPSSLIITTLRQIYALQGAAAETFQLDVAAQNVGSKPYTINTLGTTYMMDDRGIVELQRVLAFGNFESATVSRLIQPIIKSFINFIQATVVNRTNNLIRFFTSDGEGVSMTLQEGQVIGYGAYSLGKDIFCASNAEDEQGFERSFFGGSDGFVYELDKGVNFDGAAKETWFKTTFSHLGSPTQRKRYFRAFFGGIVVGEATVQLVAQYANGSPDVADTVAQSDTAIGNQSAWDTGQWDIAFFDANSRIGDVYLDLVGTGDSVSILVYSDRDRDDILTLRDILYHYKFRREMRASR